MKSLKFMNNLYRQIRSTGADLDRVERGPGPCEHFQIDPSTGFQSLKREFFRSGTLSAF